MLSKGRSGARRHEARPELGREDAATRQQGRGELWGSTATLKSAQRQRNDTGQNQQNQTLACLAGRGERGEGRTSDEVEIEGADAGDGSSPEVEAVEGQQAVLLGRAALGSRLPRPRELGTGRVEGPLAQPQPLQLRQLQPRDRHPPVDEGVVLVADGVQHRQAAKRGEEEERPGAAAPKLPTLSGAVVLAKSHPRINLMGRAARPKHRNSQGNPPPCTLGALARWGGDREKTETFWSKEGLPTPHPFPQQGQEPGPTRSPF